MADTLDFSIDTPDDSENTKTAGSSSQKPQKLVLTVPDKEAITKQVEKATVLNKEKDEQLNQMASKNAQAIMNTDLDTAEGRMSIINAVNDIGMQSVRKSAHQNDMMSKRLVHISNDGGESGDVVKGLTDLSIKMKDLDPSGIDFAKQGVLGKFFNPARRYFEKYKTADEEISGIIQSLEKGRQTLTDDNKTLLLEEQDMRDLTRNLNENIQMAQYLDQYLTDEITKLQDADGDEQQIKFLQEDVLLPLRQKTMDLQQQLLVNQQGIVAMDVMRRNNEELIRSVKRAETTTISSLRVAVTVAQGLSDQKIVIKKVDALNKTTNDMIASTAHMLKEQGSEIQQQAVQASISPDVLKKAFQETFDALDAVSEYKQKALPQIAATIQEFQEIANEGEKRLQELDDRGTFDK